MKPDDRDPVVERLMGGLEPPPPPHELRSKTLAAARRHMEAEAAPDLWSRLWNHRGLRLAWAGAAALLLAGHLFLVPGNGAVPSRVDPGLAAENRVDEQFVDLLRPIQISTNVQPIVGIFASNGGLTELDLGENSL